MASPHRSSSIWHSCQWHLQHKTLQNRTYSSRHPCCNYPNTIIAFVQVLPEPDWKKQLIMHCSLDLSQLLILNPTGKPKPTLDFLGRQLWRATKLPPLTPPCPKPSTYHVIPGSWFWWTGFLFILLLKEPDSSRLALRTLTSRDQQMNFGDLCTQGARSPPLPLSPSWGWSWTLLSWTHGNSQLLRGSTHQLQQYQLLQL